MKVMILAATDVGAHESGIEQRAESVTVFFERCSDTIALWPMEFQF